MPNSALWQPMNFFASQFDRLRRSTKPAAESPESVAITGGASAVDQSGGGESDSLLELLIARDDEEITVAVAQSALMEVSRARQLGPILISLLDDQKPAVLRIDLGQVDQLSSESLNQLIGVNCHARSIGVQLVLVNLCEPLQDVFRITRLDRLFEMAVQQ